MTLKVYRDDNIIFPGDVWNIILSLVSDKDLSRMMIVCTRLRSIITHNGELAERVIQGQIPALKAKIRSLNFCKVRDLLDMETSVEVSRAYNNVETAHNEIEDRLHQLQTTISNLPRNAQGKIIIGDGITSVFLNTRTLTSHFTDVKSRLSETYIMAKRENREDIIKLLMIGLIVIPMFVYFAYQQGQKHRMMYGQGS